MAVTKCKKTNNNNIKNIMLIGETGTGKTTLINSMMNYLYQVNFGDSYRYYLINEINNKQGGQAMSQTDKISTYYIRPPATDYALNIIDTPGFGDTRGYEFDLNIIQQIKHLFSTTISYIDAVCFVIKAPQARLTCNQLYIYSQLLGNFANNLNNNIFILFTFADSNMPIAIKSLQDSNINIPHNKYYKINNSGFNTFDNKNINKINKITNKLYWKMGMETFKQFLNDIQHLEPISLQPTQTLLRCKNEIENYINKIHRIKMHDIANLDNQLKQQKDIIVQCNQDIKFNKKYSETIKNAVFETINIEGKGIATTTCLQCNFSCHDNCPYTKDCDKHLCNVIMNGYCVKCPRKCHWSEHSNVPYILKQNDKVIIDSNAKYKYKNGVSKKNSAQKMIKKIEKKLVKSERMLNRIMNKALLCMNRIDVMVLAEIKYNKIEYLNQLINSEENNKNVGYRNRITKLQEIKNREHIINIVRRAQNAKTINVIRRARTKISLQDKV